MSTGNTDLENNTASLKPVIQLHYVRVILLTIPRVVAFVCEPAPLLPHETITNSTNHYRRVQL